MTEVLLCGRYILCVLNPALWLLARINNLRMSG